MAKKKIAPESDRRPCKMVYAGERFDDGKIMSAFVPEHDLKEERLFNRCKYFIGEMFEGQTWNDEDGRQRYAIVKKIEDAEFSNEELTDKWRKIGWAAKSKHQEHLSRMRIEKAILPEHIIEELRKATKGLKMEDAKGYLDYVVHEVIFKPIQSDLNMRLSQRMSKSMKKGKK